MGSDENLDELSSVSSVKLHSPRQAASFARTAQSPAVTLYGQLHGIPFKNPAWKFVG